MDNMKPVIEEHEYKGNNMIVLRRHSGDRLPFQFGLSKAKLLLKCVEEIKAWVEKQETINSSGGK